MTERGQNLRIAAVALLLGLAWSGLAYRLAVLHLGAHDALHARIRHIREVEQDILVSRGKIYDRKGNILAMDLAVKDVCVNPSTIISNGHVRFVTWQLSRLLDMDPAMVATRVERPGRQFEYVKRFVGDDKARQIASLQLKGVQLDDVSIRSYPQDFMFCHILGFSNQEGIGSEGIEKRLDNYLRGVPGLRISERDGQRQPLYNQRLLDIDPQPGADVYLTVDENIQYFTERALDAAMEKNHAHAAWAIVRRVKTGEILAMANRPAYNLNNYRTASEDDRMNRAIGYMYEPGSTFKVSVIAAALNEGVVKPSDVFDCENGVWHYNGRLLHDYHPYGRLTVADILKKSSNIGAAKIALKLGEKRLHDYLASFGFGQTTGCGLPGEQSGILKQVKHWDPISISRIPMGHEVAVTALQILDAVCAIANGGKMVRPYIVQRVVNSHGQVLMQAHDDVIAQPIRPEVSTLMRMLMTRVTEEGGTGTRAAMEGFTVAGKTGTAQKVIPGLGYSDSANIATFVGYLPAEDPEIAIIVVVDEPQPDHTGGVVCAPVFKDIAEQAVRYLDIPPVPAERMFRFGESLPSLEDATKEPGT